MNTIKTVLRREEELAPDSETVLQSIRTEIAQRPVRRRRRTAAAAGAAGVIVAAVALTTGLLPSGSRHDAGAPAGAAGPSASKPTMHASQFPAGLVPAPAAPAASPFSPAYVPVDWSYLYSQPSFTSYAGPGDSRRDGELFTGRIVFSLDSDYPDGSFSLRAHGRPARFLFDSAGQVQAVQVEVTETGAPVLTMQLPADGLPVSREALLEIAGTVTIRPFVQVSRG